MSLLPRISALCVSLAYLAVVAMPCAMSESIVTAAAASARDAAFRLARPDREIAKTHAGHARRGASRATPANHARHAGHAAHTQRTNSAPPALHEPAAEPEPVAQLSAQCLCGCSGSPDSAGSSSARIGFALARASWARADHLEPLRHPAPLSQPPQPPHLALDPVPG